MFLRTILYYVCTSAAAITIGLVAVNIFRPGITDNAASPVGGPEPGGQSLGTLLFEQVERMIPTNPVAAIAGFAFSLNHLVHTRVLNFCRHCGW